jgi:hypothetical protein
VFASYRFFDFIGSGEHALIPVGSTAVRAINGKSIVGYETKLHHAQFPIEIQRI